MAEPRTVTGIVLSVAPVNDYDRRAVLLTREKGKISAFADGARRPGSALSGTVMPFAFGEFTIYETRSANRIRTASISNYFSELRQDVEAAWYGFYFLEVADYYGREGVDESEMIKLVYQSLRALSIKSIPKALVRRIFELKCMCINGEGPEVFRCVVCGEPAGDPVFSVKRGGRVCSACSRESDGMKLSVSTWHTLQYIVSSPVAKLYTFTVDDTVLGQLERVVGLWMDRYVDRKFHSLELIGQIPT